MKRFLGLILLMGQFGRGGGGGLGEKKKKKGLGDFFLGGCGGGGGGGVVREKRKKEVKNYWATDPTVTTPVFSQTVSWN